jgi:hypothetical protein
LDIRDAAKAFGTIPESFEACDLAERVMVGKYSAGVRTTFWTPEGMSLGIVGDWFGLGEIVTFAIGETQMDHIG